MVKNDRSDGDRSFVFTRGRPSPSAGAPAHDVSDSATNPYKSYSGPAEPVRPRLRVSKKKSESSATRRIRFSTRVDVVIGSRPAVRALAADNIRTKPT